MSRSSSPHSTSYRRFPATPALHFLTTCYFLFGDGSVHALSNSTDPNILALLANISDGKPIPKY